MTIPRDTRRVGLRPACAGDFFIHDGQICRCPYFEISHLLPWNWSWIIVPADGCFFQKETPSGWAWESVRVRSMKDHLKDLDEEWATLMSSGKDDGGGVAEW